MNRIFIFAFNENDKSNPSIAYKGHFDGQEFIPKTGFCNSIDDLYEYDYVQIFGDDGMKIHSPKKFNDDLIKDMKKVFADVYGYEEQLNIFTE